MKRGFGSDNHSGVHPAILESLVKANQGHVASYGTDPLSVQATELMKRLFGETTETYFVFNGTAANVLALSRFVRPYNAVLASTHSHLWNDECGAPEKNLGCKIITIPSVDGKLTPTKVKEFLGRRGDQHHSQVSVISITQPTEVGCVYSLDEIKELCLFAHAEGLKVHMDGARAVNAATRLKCELREMTSDLGVDSLSLGGTKNGLMFGEAVLFFNGNKGDAQEFKFTRKQMMQLPSKTRFIAAQFLAFLDGDLWRTNALHANQMAERLSEGLKLSPLAELTQETQANACFVRFPKSIISSLRNEAFFYVWNERTYECRLMTSWDTDPLDIHQFLKTLMGKG